jgi:prepilin-type N-terminal cleavage/methylation domain-containing protein
MKMKLKQAMSRPSALGPGFRPAGFTLIELLVVISIMAVIAGFGLSVAPGIKRSQYEKTATAELSQIENALDNYKAKYGAYPPSNPNVYSAPYTNSLFPPLYYELSGVTYQTNQFVTLDGTATILSSGVQTAFGMGGFVNCTKGSGEEMASAKNFLLDMKTRQIGSVNDAGVLITNLITSVGGPDGNSQIFKTLGCNPFRYVYPGVNNPGSYDLWVQLVISGKNYLICNWSQTPIINAPYP